MSYIDLHEVVLTGDVGNVFCNLELSPCSCCFRMHNTLRNAFAGEMSKSPERVLGLNFGMLRLCTYSIS